ncbi:unnamed protein product [Haemonchus placei]|uniref:Tnp_DDE_dom domain-containing protein n=1 Tax=Haemonchus placei TaxID=6290 RepID=A0A0N4W7J8_HAEPC|nr:unnamed protein product [Haemonchus placei]
MVKSRLAPPRRSVTIQRLELSVIAAGANLLSLLTEQLDIQLRRKYLRSDSAVSIAWTMSKKTLPVCVRNRVRKIRELTTDVTIRYVPTARTQQKSAVGAHLS